MAIRVIGVDPGLASTGIAAVERRDDGVLVSRGVRLVHTKPQHDRHQRRSTDDERRIREAWGQVKEAIETFKPHALAIECYTVYGEKDIAGLKKAGRDLVNYVLARPPLNFVEGLHDDKELLRFVKALDRLKKALNEGSEVVGTAGRGKAAKTMAVYGAAMAAGWTAGIPVFIHMPIDLKTKFLKRAKGSKEEVATAVKAQVQDLETVIAQRVAPSQYEHVYDAAGHAVLGILAFEELFRNAGVAQSL